MDNHNLIFYLLKSSCVFTVLYTLYIVFFRRSSYFYLNRLYLIFVVTLSFLFPFINITYYKTIEAPAAFVVESEVINSAMVVTQGKFDSLSQTDSLNQSWLILALYALICLILIARLLFQFIRFYSDIAKNSRIDYVDGFKVVVSDFWNQSFSFFRIIVLAEKDFSRKDKDLLLKHEVSHARQLHSLDLLLAELFQIIHWFNPLVYRLKHDMIEVHEYIADDYVVGNGANTISYQQLIIECVSSSLVPRGSNAFSAKLLKNRFAMMTNNRLSKSSSLKYLLIIPAIALLASLMSFNEEVKYAAVNQSNAVVNSFDENINSDTYELHELIVQPSPSTNSRELNTAAPNEVISSSNREKIETFEKLNPKEVKRLYPLQKSVISASNAGVDTLKVLKDKLERVSANTTFLKSFEPRKSSKYSIILMKGTSYRFYVVDYNDDDLTNNLIYMEKNINPSEVKEFCPVNVFHANGYNYADFLIEETGVYHVHLPNINQNNKYIFGLHLLEANVKISQKEKQPKTRLEVKQDDDQVFLICEVLPEFAHPDYESARDFIAKNIKYPAEAMANKVEGRVFVQFVVNKDGSVSETRVVRGVNSALDNEALRVVKSMPNWVPGTQEGDPVRVSFTYPIIFKL